VIHLLLPCEEHILNALIDKVHIVTSYYLPDAARLYSWWWQKAIASPVLLQYIISLAAGHKAALGSNKGLSSHTIKSSTQDYLRFRIAAIKSLNDLLRNPVAAKAESTIVLVSAVMTIEVCVSLPLIWLLLKPANTKST
jgi:hypothetical protein